MFRLAVFLRKESLTFFFQAVEDSWKVGGTVDCRSEGTCYTKIVTIFSAIKRHYKSLVSQSSIYGLNYVLFPNEGKKVFS